LEDIPWIKTWRATAAGPRSSLSARNFDSTTGAGIGESARTPSYRLRRRANFLRGRAGNLCYPPRDTVISVLGVAAKITIQPVSHVNQFLGNDDFERPWPGEIETGEIDQNEMSAVPGVKRVRSPNGRSDSPPYPLFELPPVGRHAKTIDWQLEPCDVGFEVSARLLMVHLPPQRADPPKHLSLCGKRRSWMNGSGAVPSYSTLGVRSLPVAAEFPCPQRCNGHTS
jgi:hypothetical protein